MDTNQEVIDVNCGEYSPELDQVQSRSQSVPLAQEADNLFASTTEEETTTNNEVTEVDIAINENINDNIYDVNTPYIYIPISTDLDKVLDFNSFEDIPDHIKFHNEVIGLHPELRLSHFFTINKCDLQDLNVEDGTSITYNMEYKQITLNI